MNESVLEQLHELAEAFNKIELQPVICGGLGIYLRFSSREHEIELRATNDIDLMVTKTQAQDESNRQAILEVINDDLQYTVCENGKYFKFQKKPNNKLDILAPSIEDLNMRSNRVRLVKSKLHGHITPEALFIEEDLETVSLDDISVQIPSISNQLILKLFAYNDRHKSNDAERAQTHAYDIFAIVELSNRADYQQSREFVSRHTASEIVCKARAIISESFHESESDGWQNVLKTNIYPELSVKLRIQKLKHAARRLKRWFESS